MTIYTFNLLVGFEPNGVDVAQASRAKMLRGLGVAAKFIFTTWPTPEKLAYYLSLGHRDDCSFSFYGSTDYGPSKDGRGLANGVSTDSSGCC